MIVFDKRYFSIVVVLTLFLIQLIGITNPPLEIEHNWRQVTGLMVSRNFLEQGPDLLHPKVDDNQGGTGIIGMEFPLMNYLYYLVASVFGYSHWYGRIINVFISCFGLLAFFEIAKSLFSEKVARFSLLLLSCSIWFAFSRKMMPDTFALSLTMIGVWAGLRFVKAGAYKYLLIYFLFIALGVLSKIPAAVLGAFLFIPLFDNQIVTPRKIKLISVGALALLPALWWYFIWNKHLAETYGYWYNSGQSVGDGIQSIISHLSVFINRFIFSGFKSYIVFILMVTGALLALKKSNHLSKYRGFVIVTVVILSAYIIRSGHFFIDHDYYMLPLLPFLALLGGFAVVAVDKKWMSLLVVVGMFEGLANQQHEFFIKDSEKYKLTIEGIADEYIPKDALIVINGNGNPQQLYLSHRKGWNISNEETKSLEFLQKLQSKGAGYLILNRSASIAFDFPPIYSDENYQIFDLSMFK